jgi:hypothetical protein
MTRRSSTISWLGLFLVAFGVVMLLWSQDVIDLPARAVIWPFFVLVGLVIAARGFAESGRGKIVAGTVLFLYGLFFTVRAMEVVYLPIYLAVPAGVLIAGVAGLMLVVNNPREWYYLPPAVLLIVVGAGFIMSSFGVISEWALADAVGTWWPLALILTGAALLARKRRTAATAAAAAARLSSGEPTG